LGVQDSRLGSELIRRRQIHQIKGILRVRVRVRVGVRVRVRD
jgi:hypothetical protein